MKNDIYIHYFAHKATILDYEVRYINSWNSYDWLKEETIQKITKTMQNAKIDEPVHNILKLAVLLQNGGILLNWGTFILS